MAKRPVEILSGREVEALISACSKRAPTGIRNAALIAVVWRTGLRVSEVLALKPKDLDLNAGTLTVHSGKGDKRRVVGLDALASSYLSRWLDTRNGLGVNGHSTVFCTLDGGPVSPRYVRAMLKRTAERAGIEKRVHPHGLRHSFASELAAEGTPMPIIQKALGHAHLNTTAVYLDHISNQDVVDLMKTRNAGK